MMDEEPTVEGRILTFVARLSVAGSPDWNGNLAEDTDLLARGVIDSFNIIEIAAFLESEFDIRIESEAIRPENFSSVARLGRLVRQMQAKGSEA